MTIRLITENPNPETLLFQFDNGDKAVLEQIKTKWGFRDKESALRFALAVLITGEQNKIEVIRDGKKTTLSPADSLLEPNSTSGQ